MEAVRHTANGQTPFSTFGFGLGTSWESRLIQECILKIRMGGLGARKKTAIFPKLVFAIKDGVNAKAGDPNYDIKQLALKCSSERMYPDILSYEQLVERTGGFVTPMGCRSFLAPWQNEDGEYIYEGRNNLGVVSVNLPMIALRSTSKEEFWSILDETLLVARKALDSRIERFKGVKAKVAPILYMEGAMGVRLNAEDNIEDLFKNGRSSISLGYIGINETINALFGVGTHLFDSADRREFALAIVKHLRSVVDEWKAETGYGFSLYATPSESLCHRFDKINREVFGKITGVTDGEYLTNSHHLDVAKKVNPFQKIDFEAPYPTFASGGFIAYAECPSVVNNLKGLEVMWDYAMKHLPYFGTNTPIDKCRECGWGGDAIADEDGFCCPSCGNRDPDTLSVTKRVCGYLGNPNARAFNPGKQAEVQKRVKHMEAK